MNILITKFAMSGYVKIVWHQVRRRTTLITCFMTFAIILFVTSLLNLQDVLFPLEYRDVTDAHQNVSASRASSSSDTKQARIFLNSLYEPPKGETPEKRFPQAVIIGFPKCGTKALLFFISKHPWVVACKGETHFYDREANFSKGYEWYRQRMPLSYSNQVTIEKTPAYVRTPQARDEMQKRFPYIKLIVLVRNPVERLLSQHAQMASRVGIKNHPLLSSYLKPNSRELDPTTFEVRQGLYYQYLAPWFRSFKASQILVLFTEELYANPFKVLKKVERFLDLQDFFRERNFQYNKTSGFYCFVERDAMYDVEGHAEECLGSAKGRQHFSLSVRDEKMLYDFYKDSNEQLFRLLKQHYNQTAIPKNFK